MLRRARLEGLEPIQVHTRGAPIYSAGERKAPAVQRLYRLHTKALSAWSTFGSATRICGAFATLVRNHPNWIVVLGRKIILAHLCVSLWRPQTPSFMRIE